MDLAREDLEVKPEKAHVSPLDRVSARVKELRISDDPRAKLRSWLGKILKIVITDERIVVGCFVCTDRDGNIILDNCWEYTRTIEGNNDPRLLGLTLVPGKHIISVALMTH